MDKAKLLQEVISALEADLHTLTEAAKTAHAAATHEECAPDNKYDTTALEASYIAQGQANRAQEIRSALAAYRSIELHSFPPDARIRLTALVTLETDDGAKRAVFLGPAAGGLKISADGQDYVVVTPEAPLGRALLGKCCDDEVQVGKGKDARTFLVIDLC